MTDVSRSDIIVMLSVAAIATAIVIIRMQRLKAELKSGAEKRTLAAAEAAGAGLIGYCIFMIVRLISG